MSIVGKTLQLEEQCFRISFLQPCLMHLKDMQHYFARLLTLQVHGQDAHAQSKFASAYSFSYVAWGAYERQKRNVGGPRCWQKGFPCSFLFDRTCIVWHFFVV